MKQIIPKGYKASLDSGIYTRLERVPRRRPPSGREQKKHFERYVESVRSTDLQRNIEAFKAPIEKYAKGILQRFVAREGLLAETDQRFKNVPALLKWNSLIQSKIDEIRAAATLPNALLDRELAKRLPQAERAADALDLLEQSRCILPHLKNAHVPESGELSVWHAIVAAFSMGQVLERSRIRKFEWRVGGMRKQLEKRNVLLSDEDRKKRRDAYKKASASYPYATHWELCGILAPEFGLTSAEAFRNSIPIDERVKRSRMARSRLREIVTNPALAMGLTEAQRHRASAK